MSVLWLPLVKFQYPDFAHLSPSSRASHEERNLNEITKMIQVQSFINCLQNKSMKTVFDQEISSTLYIYSAFTFDLFHGHEPNIVGY